MPELVAARFIKINAARSLCVSNQRKKHRCEGILHPLQPGECFSKQTRFYLWELYLEPPYLRGRCCVDQENVIWKEATNDWHLTPQNFMQWQAWMRQPRRSTAWEKVKCQRPLPFRFPDRLPKEKPKKDRFVRLLKWRVTTKGGKSAERYLISLKGKNRSGVTTWKTERYRAKHLKHPFMAKTWLQTALAIMRRYDGVYTSWRLASIEKPRIVRFYPGRVKANQSANEVVNQHLSPDKIFDQIVRNHERRPSSVREDAWEHWKEKPDVPLDDSCCQTWVAQRHGRVMVRCGYARPCPAHDLPKKQIENEDEIEQQEAVPLKLQNFLVMAVSAEQYAIGETDLDHELQEHEIDSFQTTSELEAMRIVQRAVQKGEYPKDARPVALSFNPPPEAAPATPEITKEVSLEGSQYVRHKRLGRIGRVIHENEYGDVRVADVPTPPRQKRPFFPGQGYWRQENIESSSFEAWSHAKGRRTDVVLPPTPWFLERSRRKRQARKNASDA